MAYKKRRIIFVAPRSLILYEGDGDLRGRCDTEKAAMNLLLHGIRGDLSGVRMFAEINNRVVADIRSAMIRLRGELMNVSDLSARQRQVGEMLCRSMSNKEIASVLNITVRTVKFHVSALLARFQCRNRVELSLRMDGLFGRGPTEIPEPRHGLTVPPRPLSARGAGVSAKALN